MPAAPVGELRPLNGALLGGIAAAGAEGTAGGHVQGAGHVPLQHDPVLLPGGDRVRDGTAESRDSV